MSSSAEPNEPVVAITREDPMARALSPAIGGPFGFRSAGHSWWSPVRVLLLLTALTFALGMVQKTGCWNDRWQSEDVRYSQMCYSDLPYLYDGRGFAELYWPYAEPDAAAHPDGAPQAMEYPVGISYWAWGTAWVTQKVLGVDADTPRGQRDLVREANMFTLVNALGFAALTLLSTWFLVSAAGRRPWDVLGFAVAPVLAATALVNWDFGAVMLVCAALWAWRAEKPVWLGVAIGLGTAAKLYPLFLLGAVLVICLRRRQVPRFLLVAGVSVVTWLLANLPAVLGSWDRWKEFWTFNDERAADLGSLWLVLQNASDQAISADTINTWSWILFGLWCLAVLVLGLRAPVTPRFAQLGFLVVAGFLVVNKVYSPQYVLWLLPLAVLARPRLRDQVVWQAAELFYFASVWWYLGGFLKSGSSEDAPLYDLAIVLRVLGELYLVALVVRDMYRPGHDPVRAPGPRTPVPAADTEEAAATAPTGTAPVGGPTEDEPAGDDSAGRPLVGTPGGTGPGPLS